MDVARVLAEAERSLHARDSLRATAGRVAGLAVTLVPGVEAAGISLLRAGVLGTVAATDELARAVDTVQYEIGEGPCLGAVGAERLVHVADIVRDQRWLRFAERARTGLVLAVCWLAICPASGVRWRR